MMSPRPATDHRLRPLLLAASLLLPALAARAAPRDLALRRVALDLPGPPVVVVPADLDGDGRLDLTLVVAFTERGEIGIEEKRQMDEVEGLVEVMTVVPALLDHRELRVYLATAEGGYAPAGPPFALPTSVIAVEPGPRASPVVALTDDGLAALRLGTEGALSLEPLAAVRPVLAGSGALLPQLGFARDLDGDGVLDAAVPTSDGLAVFIARDGALPAAPTARLDLPLDERLPGDARHYRQGFERHYPLPVVADVDGDGKPDLLVRNWQVGWNQFELLRGLGSGRFAKAFSPLGDRSRHAKPEVAFVGDLDGDGRAELVTEESLEKEDVGIREELKQAREPKFRLRIHRLDAKLRLEPTPRSTLEVIGYVFGGEGDVRIPGGLQDLNGDGRLDLVAVTLDFSLLQAVKILAVKRITIGLDFKIWCQQKDGSLKAVSGLDLSGQFKLNLNDLRLGQLSLFAGDFDGDGKADFVQMGRGRVVSIHRGRDDCSYASQPDLSLDLAEPPADLSLVRVDDLDGDGRADLRLIEPTGAAEDGATAPVRLDLYLSGGAR